MDSDVIQQPPPASRGENPSNGRAHWSESCYPDKLIDYFVSSDNTPVHIPDVPGWVKLLPTFIIFVSLIVMVDSAYLGRLALSYFAVGLVTVATISGALVVQIWIPRFYSYYLRLFIDFFFLGFWILVVWQLCNPDAKHCSDDVLLFFASMQCSLCFMHAVISAYYIHVHRSLGRHSWPIRDAQGRIMTKVNNPPHGFWQLADPPRGDHRPAPARTRA